MYAEERRQFIVDRARSTGRVDVAALAAEFAVTTETVRRDLTALERQGVLRRVHGGAVPLEWPSAEVLGTDGEVVHLDEKVRIAKAALASLPDRGSILLDAGTTTAQLAADLPLDRELTVVTHSVEIAVGLVSRPNLTVMLLGGVLQPGTLTAVGPSVVAALRDTLVDVAFIATSGLTAAGDLTSPCAERATVKQAAVACARVRVLLADDSKLGRECAHRFAGVGDFDVFITDSRDAAGAVAALGPSIPRTLVV